MKLKNSFLFRPWWYTFSWLDPICRTNPPRTYLVPAMSMLEGVWSSCTGNRSAKPKSPIFGFIFLSRRILGALMSRCTMDGCTSSCKCFNPWATPNMMLRRIGQFNTTLPLLGESVIQFKSQIIVWIIIITSFILSRRALVLIRMCTTWNPQKNLEQKNQDSHPHTSQNWISQCITNIHFLILCQLDFKQIKLIGCQWILLNILYLVLLIPVLMKYCVKQRENILYLWFLIGKIYQS